MSNKQNVGMSAVIQSENAAVLPDTLRQMNKPLPVQKDRTLSLSHRSLSFELLSATLKQNHHRETTDLAAWRASQTLNTRPPLHCLALQSLNCKSNVLSLVYSFCRAFSNSDECKNRKTWFFFVGKGNIFLHFFIDCRKKHVKPN